MGKFLLCYISRISAQNPHFSGLTRRCSRTSHRTAATNTHSDAHFSLIKLFSVGVHNDNTNFAFIFLFVCDFQCCYDIAALALVVRFRGKCGKIWNAILYEFFPCQLEKFAKIKSGKLHYKFKSLEFSLLFSLLFSSVTAIVIRRRVFIHHIQHRRLSYHE